ncbi:MAG: hypothetical protein IPP55_03945 [Anaerolineales bacterium]|nr:hypothetical protein [Anaerolineales bacterium]
MSRQLRISLLLFLVFFIGMAIIQFSTPDLPDNDGYYHIKMAWMMRTEGLKPDFVWLPLSILSQENYYDHHFLYHVALIPFTFGDLRLGAKWAAVTFSALAFLAVWYLLDRQKVPFAWLWALGLLGISEAFIFRMSISRAQSLSLGVMALGLAWMFEGKYKHLAVLSFLYVWLYNAFPLMLAIAGLYTFAILVVEKRLEYRPLLWVGLGIAAGLVINPYFPTNLIFTYHHFLSKLQIAESIKVGNEWYPYDTGQLLDNSLPALIAFASGALAMGIAGQKMNLRTATAFFAALLFGAMLFNARRFVEYFPPFALIFAAFAWSAIPDFEEPPLDMAMRDKRTLIPVLILSIIILAGMAKTFPAVQHQLGKSKPYDLYAGASEWLLQNTNEGELIFQTDWDDFPRLFFYNTHNTYLAGLDPTYFQIYDPSLYAEWVRITRGEVEQPSSIIRSRFGVRFVHTDLNHVDFIEQAEKDPNLSEVYRDDQSVLFEVIDP